MNTHEAEKLANLYAKDTTNLQIAIGTPLIGKAAIREDFQRGYWDKAIWFGRVGLPIE